MSAQFRVKHSAQREKSTAPPGMAVRPEAFDREALAQFPSLHRAARRLTRNGTEAEDLVQETYVRALRGFGQFRAGSNLKAWLLTILRHAHLNRRRQTARSIVEVNEAKVEWFAQVARDGDTPEQRLLESAADDQLRSVNESLPLSLRQTLWLRDIEGLSYTEIAKRLGIPMGTVMSRLARARQLLYTRLTEARALDGRPGRKRAGNRK
jgi:RNA polymerase sigma-70 factor (ECF subfamily)